MAMANWEHCAAVERDAERQGGAWVFSGTNVPLFGLYEALASGSRLSEFAASAGMGVEQTAAALKYQADELHDFRLGDLDLANFGFNVNRERPGPNDAVWKNWPEVEQVEGRLGGAWVFKKTRLPLYTLFDNLAAGATVGEFVEWYDGPTESQVASTLRHVAEQLRGVRSRYANTV